MTDNKNVIAELPPSSRAMVGMFVDRVQIDCPSMKQEDMKTAVEVFAKLEQARSGYDLLKQLASCSPEDLDRWNQIITRWDSRQAQVVLDELDRRITLVSQMRKLVNEKTTDELHELHPLFEQGLWIFGPQYETVEFVSNKQLKTILNNAIEAVLPIGGAVEISSQVVSGRVEIQVDDNGVGMSDQTLRRLESESFSTKRGIGRGIGVAHARSAVESFGGYIRFASHVGRGTQVTIRLPACR